MGASILPSTVGAVRTSNMQGEGKQPPKRHLEFYPSITSKRSLASTF